MSGGGGGGGDVGNGGDCNKEWVRGKKRIVRVRGRKGKVMAWGRG